MTQLPRNTTYLHSPSHPPCSHTILLHAPPTATSKSVHYLVCSGALPSENPLRSSIHVRCRQKSDMYQSGLVLFLYPLVAAPQSATTLASEYKYIRNPEA